MGFNNKNPITLLQKNRNAYHTIKNLRESNPKFDIFKKINT